MHEELITKWQAARLVSVSEHTITYWIRTGRLAPAKRSGEPGRPYLFKRIDVVAASTKYRLEDLKNREGDRNLIPVTKISELLGVSRTAAYGIVTRYKPTKYYAGAGTQYYIDGEELYQKLQDSPYYSYLIEARRL